MPEPNTAAASPAESASPIPAMTAEELASLEKQYARLQAESAAAADPLPGPLRDAFAGGPLAHAGITLRDVVASDWIILKQLSSPLLDQLAEMTKPAQDRKPVEFPDWTGVEAVYVFTQPPAALRALLAKGRQAFSEAAAAAVADKLRTPRDFGILLSLVGVNIARSFATQVGYGSATDSAATTESFSPPPAQTASAGG